MILKINRQIESLFQRITLMMGTFALLLAAANVNAVSGSFNQNDWTGGTSANTATHTSNQTGWDEFSSTTGTLDLGAGTVRLQSSPASGDITQTTNDGVLDSPNSGGFVAGTLSGGAVIHNDGISAEITLSTYSNKTYGDGSDGALTGFAAGSPVELPNAPGHIAGTSLLLHFNGNVTNTGPGSTSISMLGGGPVFGQGILNQALSFDGIDDSVFINNDLTHSTRFAIEAWVYINDLSTRNTIIDTNTSSTDLGGVILEVGPGDGGVNRVAVTNRSGGTFWLAQTIDNVIEEHRWHHIAYVYDKNNPVKGLHYHTIYVDGIEMKLSMIDEGGSLHSPGIGVRIGSRNNGSNTFDGFIDEFAIYSNVNLSKVTIQAHYQQGLQNPTYFNLATDSSNVVVGNGGDDNPGQPDGVIAALTADVSAGASSISVDNIVGFVNSDEILIIQMQHPANAGVYEFASINGAPSGNTISLLGTLKNSYFASDGKVQIIRVPNYTNVTIPYGVGITTNAYNSATGKGGIIAFRANLTLTLNGVIVAKGKGFSGGGAQTGSSGEQGEGYAGTPSLVNTENYGGGGGGLSTGFGHNQAGGGGGGHAADGSDGIGWVNTVFNGIPYDGKGGNSYGDADLGRMFLGAGGGSGSAISSYTSGAGGNGGGIIFVAANSITGSTGRIDADGVAGGNATTTGKNAGGGGGGAGGTIYIGTDNPTLTNIQVLAGGNAGGNGAGEWTGGVGSDGRIRLETVSAPSINSDPAASIGLSSIVTGAFVSPVIFSGFNSDYGIVNWNPVSQPAGKTLTVKVIGGSTSALSSDCSALGWTTVTNGGSVDVLDGASYIRYCITLDGSAGSPTEAPSFEDITINRSYDAYPTGIFELISSPFDSEDPTNTITNITWSDVTPAGTDINFQLRSSPDGTNWGQWVGLGGNTLISFTSWNLTFRFSAASIGQTFTTGSDTTKILRVTFTDTSYSSCATPNPVMTLWDSPGKTTNLGSTAAGTNFLPAITVQPNTQYYAELTHACNLLGQIAQARAVGGANYLGGISYFNGIPQANDLAFSVLTIAENNSTSGDVFSAPSSIIPAQLTNDYNDRYFQYKAILISNTTLTTPELTDVTVSYESGQNQVTIIANDPTAPESAGTGEFTVQRLGETAAPLTVNYTVNGTATGGVDYVALSGSVVIGAGNVSSSPIVVTAINDLIAEGNETVVVTISPDAGYKIGIQNNATVTIIDDENAGITVTPTSGLFTAETGAPDNFDVVLTSEPTANVMIGLSTSDTTEGAPTPPSLTFTPGNWNIAQTVTVTGVDDAIADGDQSYSIVTAPATSSDGKYNGLNAADVTVTNADDDVTSINVNPVAGLVTTEGGGTATFNVALNGVPSANVTIGLSSSDPSEGTASPPSLVFNSSNWFTPQLVTVTGQDDVASDGSQSYTIITAAAVSADANFNGLNTVDVAVINIDDDSAGVTIIPDLNASMNWPFTIPGEYTVSDATKLEVSSGTARLKYQYGGNQTVLQTSDDGSADTPYEGGFNAGTLVNAVVSGIGAGAKIQLASVGSPTVFKRFDLPDVGLVARPALADLDNDGDLDALVGHSGGTSLAYRNTGTNTNPVWTANAAWNVPATLVGTYSKPAFADLDNDGDYDVVIGSEGGAGVAYRNTGTVTSPVWTANAAWNVPDVGTRTAPVFVDLDNDADFDVLISDVLGTTVLGYRNTGTVNNPAWAAQAAWNIATGQSTPIAASADLDNDGDFDLLIGTSAGITLGYQNTGTVSSPAWTATSAWNIYDLGSNTAPVLADIDNDGDYDVLVGENTGVSYGIQNTGTNTSPVWNWMRRATWDAPNQGGLEKPALADLDNDGDQDLMFGLLNGTSKAYENTGSAASPVWTAKAAWNIPDIGDYAAPAFTDLDNDGDYDVLVGTLVGTSLAYENTGSVTSPVWTARPAWNTVDTGAYATPGFADLDNDGDYDLLIGDSGGVTRGYRNTGSVTDPVWTANSAWNVAAVSAYSSPTFADLDRDGDYDLVVGSSDQIRVFENVGVWTQRLAWQLTPGVAGQSPVFGDLDGDQDLDLLISSQSGGTLAYGNGGTATGAPLAEYLASGEFVSPAIDIGNDNPDVGVVSWNLSTQPANTNLGIEIQAGISNNVLRKTVNGDANGGSAPLSQTVGDFELTVYTKRINEPGTNTNRYSVTNGSGNGYGITINTTTEGFQIERRDAYSAVLMGGGFGTATVGGGLNTGAWYTLQLTRVASAITGRIFNGRVDPDVATALATVTATDGTHSSFTNVNVNGAFDFDTDNIDVRALPADTQVFFDDLEDGTLSPWSQLLSGTVAIVDDGVSPDCPGACSSWTNWTGVSNGDNTYTTFDGRRYFRYRATLSTSNSSVTPQLEDITINYTTQTGYPTDNPTVVNNSGVGFSQLVSFTDMVGASHQGAIRYQISNNGSTWYYHNGTNWTVASGYAQANSAGVISSRMGSFVTDVGTGSFYFKAFLNSNGTQQAELDKVILDYVASGLTTTESGQKAYFDVVLNQAPTGNVSIGLSSSDITEGTISPVSLTFTTGNWDVRQTVTMTGVNDDIDDGDVVYNAVTAAATSSDTNYNGLNPADASITNIDDDTAGITVTPAAGLTTTESGGQAAFTVVLDSQPTASVTIGLSSNDTGEGTVSPSSLIFTAANWDAAQTVTVTGVNDGSADGNQIYNIVTAAATSGDTNYNTLNTTDVIVLNIDDDASTAGITVNPTFGLRTTEAGGAATFSVVLNKAPTANVVIGLSSSDTTEGTVNPSSLTFTTGNWSTPQTVTATGVDDAASDGNSAYTIITGTSFSTNASYNGINPADVLVTNTDDDFSITASRGPGIVTLSVVDAVAIEGTSNGAQFVITRAGNTDEDLTVNFSISGSAASGADYVSVNGSATILAGDSTVTIDIVPLDDNTYEGDETVDLKLTADPGYIISSPSSGTVLLYDNETPPPAVNIGLDQTVAEGALVNVNVYLGDSAPEYPVEIPYTVSGTASAGVDHNAATAGTIVISSGTKGGLAFTVTSDSSSEVDESVIITLGTPSSSARLGQRIAQTITITEGNVAPVVSLSAKQGNVPARWIVATADLVTVNATVTDANSADSHSYSWSASNVLVRENSTDDVFAFDPASVPVGTYTVSVTVSDGKVATTAALSIRVLDTAPGLGNTDSDGDGVNDNDEGYGDSDNDGIPNYQDASTLASAELQGEVLVSEANILNANPELNLILGTTAFASADGDANISGQVANDSVTHTGGDFDIKVTGIPQAGSSVDIVIPQTEPFQPNPVYRQLTATGWSDFVSDDHNGIASAPGTAGNCPAANDPAYTPGLTAGNHCVQLTIRDGGANDADNTANNTVSNTGGVGGGVVSITISSGTTGGGALNLYGLAALLMLLGVRIVKQRKGDR